MTHMINNIITYGIPEIYRKLRVQRVNIETTMRTIIIITSTFDLQSETHSGYSERKAGTQSGYTQGDRPLMRLPDQY